MRVFNGVKLFDPPEQAWYGKPGEKFDVVLASEYAALEARCRDGEKAREWEQKHLWSFLRSILLQGQDIALDYRDKGYESMSARVDEAAREREAELDLHRGYQSETSVEQ